MSESSKKRSILKLASFTYLLLLVFIVTPASANECHACDDPDSPYCLHMKESRYGDSFKELYHIFQAPKTDLISAAKLQDLFKVDNDPCYRSDTTIRKNLLTNQGSGCEMTTNLSLSTGKSLKVKITVPADLYALIEKSGKEVTFKTIGLPVLLEIGDPDLEADWGGEVSQIVLTNLYARIARTKGCIQYNFN